jgi:fermentation-respiration switch protein FrsA (DUF1100 family)
METPGNNENRIERPVVFASLAAIATHLVIASFVDLNAPFLERLSLAVAALAGISAAAFFYRALGRPWGGVIALTAGLPGLLTGIGIHVIHIADLGFKSSDATGVPMLIGGTALTITGTTILVRLIHTWWRRLLLAPIGIAVLIYVAFPMTLAIYATNVTKHAICCDDTPATRGFDYEDVRFETADGLELGAWYIPSQNRAAVITVHGSGSDRTRTLDEAAVLAGNGYGVLMIDIEGFGESEGRSNSFGWVGARDVHAAVSYLQTRDDVDADRIGGLGLSMGGEIMIQAAGESPELRAIVAEGATSRTLEDTTELSGIGTKFLLPFQWTLSATLRLITGEPVPPPLKEMAAQIGPRPALLIAADIKEETELNGLYQEVGGPSFDLWVIPEGDHVGAFDNHPEEYEERVISFLDDALLGDAASAPGELD